MADEPEQQEPTPEVEEQQEPSEEQQGVTLTPKEFREQQARIRRAEKRARELEEREAQREADRQREDAERKGNYDEALKAERKQREQLEARLRRASVGEALREEVAARKLSGDQARVLTRLVDRDAIEFDDDGEPLGDSVSAQLDQVMADYPDLFGKEQPPQEGEGPKPRRRVQTPAAPPQGAKRFEGYVSPEEYAETPLAERRSPEFQKRVLRSIEVTRGQPGGWPESINAKELGQDN